ncbi:hypothetical protein BST20_01110 [Mycobacterium branderi]|uniref:Uncharacterized protein n=1 Tax=Mycobacterium branderi TaxID=43348 RepID=A0AA91M1G6_9MYCO|nr:hypothetical protein BST20_01110 [Mycobacterium branderi]
MATTLTCSICGTSFQARADARYCSPACRQKAHRARHAQRVAASAGGPTHMTVEIDTGGAIQRARKALARSRELRRAARDTVQRATATRQRIAARYPELVRSSRSGRDDAGSRAHYD